MPGMYSKEKDPHGQDSQGVPHDRVPLRALFWLPLDTTYRPNKRKKIAVSRQRLTRRLSPRVNPRGNLLVGTNHWAGGRR